VWVFQRVGDGWKGILAITLLYLVLWAAILPAASDCFVYASDNHCSTNAGRSLQPLHNYLRSGTGLQTSDTDQIHTIYPIGYSIVLFATGGHEGAQQFLPVILFQALLLLLSGFIVYAIAVEFFPGLAVLAFGLSIFNPNSLFVAVQPREDTIFAFLIVLAMVAAFSFIRRPGWGAAILCGIALGLSANFRPAGQYLIYVIPLMLALFGAFSGLPGAAINGLKKGLLGALLGWLLIVPWMSHLHSAGEDFGLTDSHGKHSWASDFRAQLADIEERGIGFREALFQRYDDSNRKRLLFTFSVERAQILANSVPGWGRLSERAKYKLKLEDMLAQLSHFRLQTYFIAALPNWRALFISGGEGEYFKAIGLHPRLNEIRDNQPLFFFGSKAVFIGFSLTLKVLALFGIWHLIRRRRFDVITMFSGVVLFFTLVHIYHGSPRYRVPIEPIFTILAVYGLNLFADTFDRISKRGLYQKVAR